ncbi:elongation factor P 5-aminopentanone reductase [Lactobacillus psittaci]|uniref:Oxidoreductase, short chain dehydrogenase reductase family n=1 Tax=Lactobacillus psittaci DSM 15354 TaxID=1122152 RepID=A0A0R1SBC9_9LACO|nr:SDR family NAD(P)-dependent oxidoreductase [Lactobacillus psittaci]KRL63874.1 oxidoreductase, short chain dehydrogenase reductase family [Lactobacillus psittaci DSM 15354]
MKRAIVFGATGGIGQSICGELAANGWSLYIHYSHNQEKADLLAEKLTKQYPMQDFLTIKLDFLVSNQDLESFCFSLLPINAAIFAQGITHFGFFGEQELDNFDQEMKVNLLTPLKLTKLLEPILLRYDHSRLIYLGSVYGGQGSPLESAYSASKAALSRFCQSYAREVASSHLTVNCLAPGAVDTAMNSIFSEETLNEVKEEIPAGRLAKGDDISYWVANLLRPESDYLTGQTIYISGGWLV